MKTVLVTGANRGIGFEICRQLILRNCRVIATARKPDAADELRGIGCDFEVIDIGSTSSVKEAAGRVADRYSSLDVLINNAAILLDRAGDILALDEDTLRQTLETNLFGPLRVSQAFADLLNRSDQPRIINVSSGAGQLSDGLQSWAPAYSISKTALNGLNQQLAAALPDCRVNAACPGWVRTEMGGSGATRTVEEGAADLVWAALDAPAEITGVFWKNRQATDW